MGVPKFFRYISERYPCLSELVREYQIPEFDNLYLDMNGIIHMCSHPDDNNPHFRITEEKIFKDVFHYVEVLFRMIRPQKLFFMAVDGVAPRAKMNQQRGRRFRSAKDAEKQAVEATKKGEKLPEEARFDPNCITPGTVFMARLHEQLKYFVVEKISNDPLWQKCTIILSGHETPGEGEHKIMDYIRYMRSQPGYDPNTRHCLYGLDADLIMLGLCTHEPHFSLLREEVKFGKKSKRTSVPEETTFFLLHLSLMREYLELEFFPLRDKLKRFDFDIEKIIDDWVLMGFLVGNDFIPNLPNMHIADGALPVLYKAYMDTLPELDGYINEAGTLNLHRFEKFMESLSSIDTENFEEFRDDLLYMESKTRRKGDEIKNLKFSIEEALTEDFKEAIKYVKPRDKGLEELIQETEDMMLEGEEESDDLSEDDEAFMNYKKEYYRNKLEYDKVTPEVLKDQAEGYVKAIQWNLNYYYNGCCSWSWYYPHHYSPYISDIKGFSNLKIEFDMGKPFLPFEQLLAVLPAACKDLLPKAYHDLMTEENSIIKRYYPEDFQTDLNGKKQEWEAVVLVPFIDENVLLEAMRSCNEKLTDEERRRNSHGPMLIYKYTSADKGTYSAPDYFPAITHNHTEVSMLDYTDVLLPREEIVKGLYPGVRLDIYFPGFPTMKHLKYTGELKKAKIKVFEQPSRNENMILTIIPNEEFAGDYIPVDLLGTTVYVGWPHMIEAKVVAITNSRRKYISMGGEQYNVEDKSQQQIGMFSQEVAGAREIYDRRLGVDVGDTKVLVHVQLMIGRKYIYSPNGRLTLEKQFAEHPSHYPLQTVVTNIATHDSEMSLFRDVDQVFPRDSVCFTLTNPYYGSQGVVQDSSLCARTGRIKICISVLEEPAMKYIAELYTKSMRSYKTIHTIASQLAINHVLFARITGSIFVSVPNREGSMKNVNIGLDLKLNKKNKETPGYTRRIGSTWWYTDKTADLVREYCEKFPMVWVYLSKNSSFENISAEKLFGDDYEDHLAQLQKWLKSSPSASVERQICGSCIVEPEIIDEIEKTVDKHKSTNQTSKKVTMQIKPTFLYRPEVQSGTLSPDPKVEVRILDRVVNIRTGFSVPFALKGTVVGIHPAPTGNDRDIMYDVFFDKPFNDGMKFGTSNEERGYRVPKTAFINISYGQRLMVEKTGGKTDEIIAKAEANYHPSYYSQQSNYVNACPPSYQPPSWLPPQMHPLAGQPLQQRQQPGSAFAHFKNGSPSGTEGSQCKMVPQPGQSTYGTPHLLQKLQHGTGEQRGRVSEITNKERSYVIPQRGGGYAQSRSDSNPRYSVHQYRQGYQNCNNSFMPHFMTNAGQSGSNSYQSVQQPPQQPSHLYQQSSQQPSQHPEKLYRQLPQQSSHHQPPQLYQQPPQQGTTKSPPRSKAKTVEPQVGAQKAPVVNTDFLKRVLKIGESENNQKATKKQNTPPSTKQKKEARNGSSNFSFDMLKQVANAPASTRLLTYYQSNGLGTPRYQYFKCGEMTKAQITLDGQNIVGKPSSTKEDASDDVASIVLRQLMDKPKKERNEAAPNSSFPEPPKTWVASGNASEKVPPSTKKLDVDSSPLQVQKNKAEAATTVLNNPFVPLQAVKKHIAKTVSTNNVNKASVNAQDNNQDIPVITKNVKSMKVPYSTKGNGTKPKRKTRIAANFEKKE